jgi:hypothetical protein
LATFSEGVAIIRSWILVMTDLRVWGEVAGSNQTGTILSSSGVLAQALAECLPLVELSLEPERRP